MSLEVGVDSYVTVSEADNIIDNYFVSGNDVRIKWNTLSDSDKEALLRHSCRSINNLKFNGRRAKTGQRLEFPRIREAGLSGVGYRLFVSQFYDNSLEDGAGWGNGLEQAKQAQVVNAAWHGFMDKMNSDQAIMNVRGLISKKAGPIEEKYSNRQTNTYNRDMAVGIYSKEVYSILTPWYSESRYGI